MTGLNGREGHWSDCSVHNEPAFPNGPCDCGYANPDTRAERKAAAFPYRLNLLVNDVRLAKGFSVGVRRDHEEPDGRLYLQIKCWRQDVITGEMDFGYGGKFYVTPEMSEGDIVKGIFGLYLAYVEHEARETFQYLGARVFGPHTAIRALVEAAKHVDIPSAKHEGDR